LFRYLLGGLAPEERGRVEKDVAADPVLREELQEAEYDLIDAYVCERLSESQCSQFETYFLDSDEKRERVEMAEILMSPAVRRMAGVPEFGDFARDAAVTPSRLKPPWGNWLAFARLGWAMVMLALAIATMLVMQNIHLRSRLERSSSGEVNSRNQIVELQNQISELQRPDKVTTDHGGLAPKGEISLLLSPGQQRSGEDRNGPALLKLPPLPGVVLTLKLEQDRYPQYDVSVKTVDGKEIWSKRALKSQPGKSQSGSRGEHVVVARFPSDLLAPGDYFIRVSARTPGGEQRSVDAYSFAVTR
jgi:hypothetical protein